MSFFDQAVSRFMSAPVLTIGLEDDLSRADEVMRGGNVSAVLVLGNDGSAAGVISRRDLLRAGRIMTFARRATERHLLDLPAVAAADVMTRPVVAVAPGDAAGIACRKMAERGFHRVFVLDGSRPAGVFSTRDVMSAIKEARLETPLGDLVRGRDVIGVDVDRPLREALETLERAGIGGAVVFDGNAPVGLFTEREALEARGCNPETLTEEAMTAALLCLPVATPLFRAAAFALDTTARRILVTDHHRPCGVVTGIDFARAAAGQP